MMIINGTEKILSSDGSYIKRKDAVVYLGSVTSKDSSIQTELSRRIGLANQAFNKLERLWKKTSISITRKLEVFDSCVVSRLMYALQAC